MLSRFLGRALCDPRDIVFLQLAFWITIVQLPFAIALLALGSFACTPGLAVGVMPEWDAMQPMRLSDRASAQTASC